MTHDSTSTFKGLFKDLVFKSVALVRKFMGYFRFFLTRTKHFTTVNPNTLCKNFTNKSFKLLFIKSKKFQGHSAMAKNLRGGGGGVMLPSAI